VDGAAGRSPTGPEATPTVVGAGESEDQVARGPEVTARVLGIAVVAAGLSSVLGALDTDSRFRLIAAAQLLTPGANELAAGSVALAGLALVAVGRGVLQRRRAAAGAAAALLVAAIAAHLLRDDLPRALVCGVLLVLFVRNRGVFVVAPGPDRFRRVARLALGLVALDVGIGALAVVLDRHRFAPSPTPGLGVREVSARLIGSPGPLSSHGAGGDVLSAVTLLGAVTIAAVLLTAFAPLSEHDAATDDERDEIRALAERSDADTLAPFALRSDKRYVRSPDGRAAVAYRYLHGTGMAGGSPVGESASFGGAVAEFVALCDRNGWRPAVYLAGDDAVAHYRAAGLRGFYIGDEAVLEVDRFTLDGHAMRGVRQAVNRTTRAGITVEIQHEGEVDAARRDALLGIAAVQRGRAPERGWAMSIGGLLDGSQPGCLLAVAVDATGAEIAFQRYVPCAGGRALSLDVMRRRPDAPNGVHEHLIVATVAWAREHGAREVSLNFAAFRVLFEEGAELASAQRVEAWLARRLEGRFGIQMDSLRRFNAKFRPRWVPRYFLFRAPGDLPAVGLAVMSAEAYLPFDRRRPPSLPAR